MICTLRLILTGYVICAALCAQGPGKPTTLSIVAAGDYADAETVGIAQGSIFSVAQFRGELCQLPFQP